MEFFLEYQESEAMNKINFFSPQYPTQSVGFYFFMMDEFEPVVVVADIFEKKERNKKSSTSWKFRNVKTLMPGTKIDSCPIENLSTAKNFSIPTPIDDLKAAVLEKNDFENREKLKLRCVLWKFRTIRTLMEEKKQ